MNFNSMKSGGAWFCACNMAFSCLQIRFWVFLFMLFSTGVIKAQNNHPSCNITGPLEAIAKGNNITITVQIANSGSNPSLNYHFVTNTSGASIKSKGHAVYNSSKNSTTQQLVIYPGRRGAAEFNLRIRVRTRSGTSECSKSVSVSE